MEGTEFRQGRRGQTGYLLPRRLRLGTDQVAREIVALADRPRPFVVRPRLFRIAVALNLLAPGLVDRLVWRVMRGAPSGS